MGDYMNTAIKVRIGDAIRKYRKVQGLTLEELGKKMGISGSLVGQYERGVVNPKYETIVRFADALNVEPVELLGRAFMDVIGPEQRRMFSEPGVVAIRIYDSGRLERVTIQEQLEDAFSALNIEGQKIAVERVKELTEIPKYQRQQDTPAGQGEGEGETKK